MDKKYEKELLFRSEKWIWKWRILILKILIYLMEDVNVRGIKFQDLKVESKMMIKLFEREFNDD